MSGVRKRIPHRDHAKRTRERPSDLSRVRQQEIGATDHGFHRTDDQKKLIRIGDPKMRIGRIAFGFLPVATVFLGLFKLHETGHAQDLATDVATGKAIYEQHSAKCLVRPVAATGHRHKNRWCVRRIFTPRRPDPNRTSACFFSLNGLSFSPMHAWRDRLSPAEQQDVLVYIRVFSELGR